MGISYNFYKHNLNVYSLIYHNNTAKLQNPTWECGKGSLCTIAVKLIVQRCRFIPTHDQSQMVSVHTREGMAHERKTGKEHTSPKMAIGPSGTTAGKAANSSCSNTQSTTEEGVIHPSGPWKVQFRSHNPCTAQQVQ